MRSPRPVPFLVSLANVGRQEEPAIDHGPLSVNVAGRVRLIGVFRWLYRACARAASPRLLPGALLELQ